MEEVNNLSKIKLWMTFCNNFYSKNLRFYKKFVEGNLRSFLQKSCFHQKAIEIYMVVSHPWKKIILKKFMAAYHTTTIYYLLTPLNFKIKNFNYKTRRKSILFADKTSPSNKNKSRLSWRSLKRHSRIKQRREANMKKKKV